MNISANFLLNDLNFWIFVHIYTFYQDKNKKYFGIFYVYLVKVLAFEFQFS